MSDRDPTWLEDYRDRQAQERQDADYARRERADRVADYTPASPLRSPGEGEQPKVTGAMIALAFTVLHEEEHELAAQVLAQLVLGEI